MHIDSHTIYDILCIASSESYGNRNLFDGAILYRISPQDAREICKFLSGCELIPTGTTLKDMHQRYDPYNIHSNFANYGDTGVIKLDTEPEYRDGEVIWYKYWVSSHFRWRKSQYYKC